MTARGEPNPMTDNEETMTVWLTAMEGEHAAGPGWAPWQFGLGNASSYLRIR